MNAQLLPTAIVVCETFCAPGKEVFVQMEKKTHFSMCAVCAVCMCVEQASYFMHQEDK